MKTPLTAATKRVGRLFRCRASWLDVGVLVLVAVLIGLANWLWIKTELRPPHWDMGRHLFNSVIYFEFWQGHHWRDLLTNYLYYPPLVYWQALPWYSLFGKSISTAVTSNFPFILLLLLSVYAIGRHLWGRLVGLVAAVTTLATPMLVTQFKEFQLDAPVTSLAAATLYALIKSEEFRRPWWSWLVGIGIGVGMLCKWTFVMIMGLPLAYAVIVALIEALRQRDPKRLLGLVNAATWAYILPSVWYLVNNRQIQIDLLSNGVGAGIREGDPAVGTLASNLWYLLNLVNVQLYLLLILVLTLGVVVLLKHRQEVARARYLILAVVGILLVFTLLRNKDPRYTLPAVPFIVLLGCAGLAYAKGWWRNVWAGGLVVYSVAAFLIFSFGWPWRADDVAVSLAGQRFVLIGQHGYIIGAPTREDWHQQEVVDVMAKRPGPVILGGLDTIWFNRWGLLYYTRAQHIPFATDVADARYMVVRVNDSNPATNVGWILVKSYKMPDRSKLFLYERDPSAAKS